MKPSPEADQLLSKLPADRKEALTKLRNACLSKLNGFTETVQSGMIAYVVPHSSYPKGYHCDPKQPLPFLYLASQKAHVAVYHMGIYADAALLKWFTETYPKHSNKKLDMGKSCIRFKNPEEIPFGLMETLFAKMDAESWIAAYERLIKR